MILNLFHTENHSSESFTRNKLENREVLYEIGDAQLWQEFQLGNEKAYAVIYKNNVSSLYSYGLKIVNNKDLVQDCIQDLFVEIWNNKDKLGKVKSIKPYLYTCVRRKLISEAQKSRSKATIKEKDVVLKSLSSSSIEKSLIEKQNFDQQKKRLKEAMEKLTKKQKEILHLKYSAQLSYDEITQIMSLSKKGAYKLVDRAIRGLRKYMLK
ncbi:sigma-70 family RNA polymerase sigma factor [Algibacter sp. 2305UL17-15]|uniref:RNA polymerase sigma factor n=1 Tax=Algibacter sp. 2305UL17-15 TaxID=3231268 RepID=UPI0034593E36